MISSYLLMGYSLFPVPFPFFFSLYIDFVSQQCVTFLIFLNLYESHISMLQNESINPVTSLNVSLSSVGLWEALVNVYVYQLYQHNLLALSGDKELNKLIHRSVVFSFGCGTCRGLLKLLKLIPSILGGLSLLY